MLNSILVEMKADMKKIPVGIKVLMSGLTQSSVVALILAGLVLEIGVELYVAFIVMVSASCLIAAGIYFKAPDQPSSYCVLCVALLLIGLSIPLLLLTIETVRPLLY